MDTKDYDLIFEQFKKGLSSIALDISEEDIATFEELFRILNEH